MRLLSNFCQLRKICILFLGLSFLISFESEAFSQSQKNVFLVLQKKLIEEGDFDKRFINKIYNRPKVFFDKNSVSGYFRHNEAKLNYGQFTTTRSIKKAKSYLSKYSNLLKKAQTRYGVDKEIITAIFLVETYLGKILGNSYVFNTLSTMAVLSEKKMRDFLWDEIPKSKRISRKRFKKKAADKSRWAYKELKKFLQYSQKEGIDPTVIKGSYAGAFGICQFIPSSVVRFGQDGNKDGRINLFDHSDAIASTAAYLKHFGWKPMILKKKTKAHKVVLHYNYSNYYARTVLKVADLLKK